MPEWATALIGVVIGILATSFWQWNAQREKYRLMTFEKRLGIYQKLYYLNESLFENIGNKTELEKISKELKEFWKNNKLYLDRNTSRSTLASFEEANNYIRQLSNQSRDPGTFDEIERRFIGILDKNLKDIEEGAGVSHLPRKK